MSRTLIRISLSPMIMVAQHIAMIGSKTDHGIIIHIFFFQRFNNLPYLVIDKSDICIIMPSGFNGILIPKITKRSIRSSLFRIQTFRIFATPISDNWLRYIRILIHIQITLRRIIRTMRTCKRDFKEQWLIIIIITNQFTSGLPCPGCRM